MSSNSKLQPAYKLSGRRSAFTLRAALAITLILTGASVNCSRHRTKIWQIASVTPLRILVVFAACMLPVAAACAQQPTEAQDLKQNPLVALRQFEPPANQEYEIGCGDEISVEIAGRPELSSKHIVGPDGRVTLPLAGAIELVNKTRAQAAQAIELAMQPYYSSISATVGVDKYASNHVLLLGYVEHPGVVTFAQPPTLLDVLTRGGAVSDVTLSAGSGNNNVGSTIPQQLPAVPERVAIYRGENTVMWVDVKGLLDSGSPLADLRLKRNDIIYVPSPHDRYVSVLGQVLHPGAIPLRSTTTLPQLLAEAGGLSPQAGRYPDIQVIQPSTGKTRVISFKAVLQPNAIDLTLHPGDVVYIPQSGLGRLGFTLTQISPLVSLFTTAALLGQ